MLLVTWSICCWFHKSISMQLLRNKCLRVKMFSFVLLYIKFDFICFILMLFLGCFKFFIVDIS